MAATSGHLLLHTLMVDQAAWLLRAVTCIDLTTLSGDDTASNVNRLCLRAAHPIREDLLKEMGVLHLGKYLIPFIAVLLDIPSS